MDGELEVRLRAMLDRDAIWQLVQRFCRGVDRLDAELIRSCYWEDAIDDHGRFVGRADDFVCWVTEACRAFPMQQHAVFNHVVELDGDDAYAETSYQCANILPTPPHMLTLGRYIDHFQRRGGEWRIADRIVLVERNIDMVDSTLIPAEPGAHPVSRDRTDVSYLRPVRPRQPG